MLIVEAAEDEDGHGLKRLSRNRRIDLLPCPSFPRRRESRVVQSVLWIPAFAGMTKVCAPRAQAIKKDSTARDGRLEVAQSLWRARNSLTLEKKCPTVSWSPFS